jgi:hypothetical protein
MYSFDICFMKVTYEPVFWPLWVVLQK